MTSFCECDTCKEIKKRILNPRCSYCGEHHDSRVHCIAEVAQRSKDKQYSDDDKPCPACGTVHDEGRIGCPDDDTVKEIFEEDRIKKQCAYFVRVGDGKYTVFQRKNGSLAALRYNQPWRDLTGDNLVFYLMVELVEAREKLEKIKYMAEQNENLNGWIGTRTTLDIIKGE